MIKTSDPAIKDGLGIMARLIVIAMLLGVLGSILQGCNGPQDLQASVEKEIQSVSLTGIYYNAEMGNMLNPRHSAGVYQLPF